MIVCCLLFVGFALPVLAQETATPSTDDPYGLTKTASAANLRTGEELPQLIGRIIQSGLGLLGIIFFLFMVYGGFIWMKARGNEKEVERAKNILTDSVIGIVIVAAAYAITAFVIRALTQ